MSNKGSSHDTTDKVAKTVHEAVDSVAERAAPAEERVRESAAKAAERAREGAEYARARTHDMTERVCDYVKENPLMALGIAFAAGTVVSSILRRH